MLIKFFYLINFIRIIFNKRIVHKGFVKLQPGVSIKIEKGGLLVLGNNILFKKDTVVYVKKNAKLEIGDNCSTGHNTEISVGQNINIGNDVFMAAYSYISDQNHAFDNKNTPFRLQNMTNKSVHIGNNVWIGRQVMILPGSSVKDHTVVAAGAVVTKDISECNVLLAGIPAEIKKRL